MNFANVKALAIPEGNVKQIADGQGVVLWKKESLVLKIVRITNPSKGSSSITGDRSATMHRNDTSTPSSGTFVVYYEGYDVSKGAGIRLTGRVSFGSTWTSYLGYVRFNGESSKTVNQTSSGSQNVNYDFTIYPTTKNGYFNVLVQNGYNYSGASIDITLNLTAL